MKKSVYIIIGVAVFLIIIVWILFGSDGKSAETLEVPVKQGQFKIAVTTSGELEAKKSEKIYGPDNLNNVRIWEVKIEDIVPDGTVVDSGDYVASLDRTELAGKLKDQELELEQIETQHTKTMLDTTLEMRSLRDDLINLNYVLEEKKIQLEQSKFEPPATIRQVEIELEKAGRSYDQAGKNYSLKLEKAKATMQDVTAQLTKAQRKYDEMANLLKQFTVFAPKSGMVIYKRGWDGKKMGIGAQISTWDNVVATLPNLTEMISKTYVNEIDISKVKVGQKVELGIDAFPEKKFTGVVKEVANIGEQMKNTNAKVFEVMIQVNEFDSVMRPAMTTKNIIITDIIDDVLFIPIECVHTGDSISYVVAGNVRKQVIVGKTNENEIIINAGLEKDDDIYIVPPEGYESYRIHKLPDEVIKQFSIKQPIVQVKDEIEINNDTLNWPDTMVFDKPLPKEKGNVKRFSKPDGAVKN
jgi:multidrug efflux pump subunit AcrA (membrane-fusion protein)